MTGKAELEIISLIKDLQKQINYLEKKVDMLVNRSSEGASKGRSYSSSSSKFRTPKRNEDKRDSRFGAKTARSGRSDEGRTYPKKRIPFSPYIKKGTDKPVKKKVTGNLKKKK